MMLYVFRESCKDTPGFKEIPAFPTLPPQECSQSSNLELFLCPQKTESKETKRKHRKDKSDKKEKHEKERKKEKRKSKSSEKTESVEIPAAEQEKPDEPSIMELKEETKQVC